MENFEILLLNFQNRKAQAVKFIQLFQNLKNRNLKHYVVHSILPVGYPSWTLNTCCQMLFAFSLWFLGSFSSSE